MVVMVLGAVVSAGAQSSGRVASGVGVAGSAAAKALLRGAQAGPVTPIQLPKNPNKLMALAARMNGLAALNDRPWHLKAMYQTYDEDGKPALLGTLEEWWVSGKKYKYIYIFPGFDQTTYRNGKHEVVTGDAGWPAVKTIADWVGGYLWTPLPSAEVAANPRFYVKHRTMGRVELTCAQSAALSPLLHDDAVTLMAQDEYQVPTTCFAEGSAAARVEVTWNGLVVVMNSIVEFDGHYIAKQITLEDGGIPVVTLQVMQLDFPKSIPDAAMQASDAPLAKAGEFLEVPAGVMARRRVGGQMFEAPIPPEAKHIGGYVELSVNIDEKGNVVGEQRIMGPRILVDLVEKWVKTWTYKPYRVKGKRVKVKTWTGFVFRGDTR